MRSTTLSISTKIFLGFVLLLLTNVGVDLWHAFQLKKIGTHIRILRKYQQLTTFTSQFQTLKLSKKSIAMRIHHATQDSFKSELHKQLQFPPFLQANLQKNLNRLDLFRHSVPQLYRHHLKTIHTQLLLLLEHLQTYMHTLSDLRLATNNPNRFASLKDKFISNDRILGKTIRNIANEMEIRLSQTVYKTQKEEKNSIWGLLLISLFAIFVGLIILILSLEPIRRIRDLVAITQNVQNGNYLEQLKIPSRDEIGILAEEFNRMMLSLHERDVRLAQKRRQLEEAYKNLQKHSEQLLHSERLAAIGRIAAQITHEIRNPLNAIGLNLELLEEDIQKLNQPNEPLSVLRAAMDEVERLTQITEEYLRFARLPPPQLQPTHINQLLTTRIKFLRQEFDKKGIQWELTIKQGLPKINCDHQQLWQALLNLIRNAIEAATLQRNMPPTIGLLTDIGANGITIEIKDNGAGISPEKQMKIFDPFFSTKETGSGLGLPLTQQIISGHGGYITCESKQDLGTSFLIFLPKL